MISIRERFGVGLFLAPLGVILVGYMFLGRSFAYLGFPPLYLGEVVLALGVIALLFGLIKLPRLTTILVALFAYMGWGAILTVAALPAHGVDALRDGVIWGYGIFAILVAGALARWPDWPERVVRFMTWPAILLVAWMPALWAMLTWAPEWNVATPAGQPLLQMKPGDMAVHLAGVGALAGFGLILPSRLVSHRVAKYALDAVWWVTWWVGVVIVSSLNRGGMLALLASVMVLVILRPRGMWSRPAVTGALVILVFLIGDIRIDTGARREISLNQIAANLMSLPKVQSLEASAGDAIAAEEAALAGTVRWRVEWWAKIVDYTIRGPHFWTGKGFGLSLARTDEIVGGTPDLRSPHNISMTVLARMGVPGAVLWLAFLALLAVSLIGGYFRRHMQVPDAVHKILAAVLVYLVAALVNGSFDVYLEGPQGGIWFWAVVGVGMAWLRLVEGPYNEGRSMPVRGPTQTVP
jgi:hypothetical protein